MLTVTVQVDRGDLYLLLVSDVRYALGRRSGVAFDVQDRIKRYVHHLTWDERQNIVHDIRGEMLRNEYTLGPVPDEGVWLATINVLDGVRR